MITIKENTDEKILLEFTNGDIEKYNAVMEKYKFKDAQAFIRFASSILLENSEGIALIKDGKVSTVTPVKELLKDE